MTNEAVIQFLKKLDENTTYFVKVKVTEHNPEHKAILFVGFHGGGYCSVYHYSYERPLPLKEIHSIRVIKKLVNLKN
jgi:predicted secreted protein